MNHDHKIFQLSDEFALTHETIARFRSLLNDPKARSQFLKDSERAVAFLSTLAEGSAEWQDCLVEALCTDDVVFDLIQADQIDAVWSMILQLSSLDRQLAVLTAPEIVLILTKYGKADAVRHLLLNFPDVKHRLLVCRAPYAIFGMAKYGNTVKTLSMIKDFPETSQQAEILSVSHVIYGLIDNLKTSDSRTLLSIIERLSKDQQAKILASDMAVLGLVKNGKIDHILSWMRTFSRSQLACVRNAAYVVPVLSENANPIDIEFFIKGLPEKRENRSRKELMSIYRSGQRHLH